MCFSEKKKYKINFTNFTPFLIFDKFFRIKKIEKFNKLEKCQSKIGFFEDFLSLSLLFFVIKKTEMNFLLKNKSFLYDIITFLFILFHSFSFCLASELKRVKKGCEIFSATFDTIVKILFRFNWKFSSIFAILNIS